MLNPIFLFVSKRKKPKAFPNFLRPSYKESNNLLLILYQFSLIKEKKLEKQLQSCTRSFQLIVVRFGVEHSCTLRKTFQKNKIKSIEISIRVQPVKVPNVMPTPWSHYHISHELVLSHIVIPYVQTAQSQH